MPCAFEVRPRADRTPQMPEGLEIDMSFEPLANVTRREPAPDDIREKWRHVVQRLRLDARFVGRRQHRQARSETGPEDADTFEPLLVQPCDGTSRVDDCLPAHLQRPDDVR